MREILLLTRRELGAYFNQWLGWGVIAAVLVLNGLLFNVFAVGSKPKLSTEVLEGFFYVSFGTVAIAALLLTMRSFVEERQTGTHVLLDSSPLTDLQLVLGKYMAALTVVSLTVLLTLHMPALILLNGKVSVGHLVAGYLGLLLVGSTCAAVGLWSSVLARTQLLAAVLGAGVLILLTFSFLLAKVSSSPLSDLFAWLAMFDHQFNPFRRGRIHLSGIVYFVSLSAGFLALAVRALAQRRWA